MRRPDPTRLWLAAGLAVAALAFTTLPGPRPMVADLPFQAASR